MKARTLLLLGWFLLGLAPGVRAQFTSLTNNGAITITGYTGTNGIVTIPTMINGLPVTSISSFYGSFTLTNVTIPSTVTNIAAGAFDDQSSLTAIFVDPQNAYYSSSDGVLFDKPLLTLVQAPGGITGSYSIPGSVTSLDDNAFSGCYNLSGITIPDSVTNIGMQAFYDCFNLTNMQVGSNVLSIGDGAFSYCQNLGAIIVDGQNPSYSSVNGVLFDKPQLTLIHAPGALTGSYAIPAGVTSIEYGAFEECSSLTNVTMPDSVTNVGDYAFEDCGSLTSFALGVGVVSIGDYAFGDCTSLTAVTLGTNLASIGPQAFYYCSSLAELSLPDSVTSIGAGALENCGSLTNLALGTQVASIGIDALANCAHLTSVVIPASVTNLGSQVFEGCASLTAILVDGLNPYYSSAGGALYNRTQTMLIQVPGGFVGPFALPSTVTNLGYGALAGCPSLPAISVAGQNQYYTAVNGVLFDKLQTTLIQCPGGIGGGYAVSNGITSLGATAFFGCSNLTSIAIPSSVTNVGFAAFDYCPYTGIYFDGNAPGINYSGPFGFPLFPPQHLIEFGNHFYNPNSEAVYYLPGTTGWAATFEGLVAYLWTPPYVCTTLSNSITINGFVGSGSAVTIPDMIDGLPVTAIADGTFDNAAALGLTNISLGVNVASIGNYAFAACTSLTSVTIPKGVTSIGSDAFAFCDNLTSVYFQGNAPSAGSGVFFQWTGPPFFPVYEPPAPTTVYYLPGTTGWSTNFAGRLAVLWNPEALTTDGKFGVGANGFGFTVTGASNLVAVVEACTNLSTPNWQPLQTFTLTNSSADFRDPQWTNDAARFYRFASP